MKLNFLKMNGAGNDFVCLDNRAKKLRLTRKQIARLCCRQFGVGADGLLVLEPGSKLTDFRMRYYNADGGEAEMCGNGARCFARFAQKVTGIRKKQIKFDTGAGLVGAEFFGKQVRVELTSPHSMKLNQKIETSQGTLTVNSINTGVPHVVLFVDDLERIDIQKLGAELRYHKEFQPKGTNVNFAQVLGPGKIKIRTYERGVEGETLACGTGVTAVALISSAVRGFQAPVSITVLSGDVLKVLFKVNGENFESVKLHGPANFTFKGEADV
jgi:diaminopimelate epimerase